MKRLLSMLRVAVEAIIGLLFVLNVPVFLLKTARARYNVPYMLGVLVGMCIGIYLMDDAIYVARRLRLKKPDSSLPI